MHVFLTGEIQSGKSTAIRRFLDGRGGAVGGFCTRWDRAAGLLELRLLGAPETGARTVARMTPQGARPDPAAFDAAAEALLSAPRAGSELLVMDELGFLEACSPRFQAAVFALLDGPVPVLGVLRRRTDGPFWAPLHRRTDVRILELNRENRDAMPSRLRDLLG